MRNALITLMLLIAPAFWTDLMSDEHDSLDDVISKYQDTPLNDVTLAFAIKETKIQHPEMVYRQAMLESGYLRSKLCTRSNNIFGMKRPRTRVTYANRKTVYGGYATFDSWVHSVADYKMWQGYAVIRSYPSFLKKKKYSTNPKYISLLKSVFIREEVRNILVSS